MAFALSGFGCSHRQRCGTIVDENEAWKVSQGVSMASDKLVRLYVLLSGLLVQDCELKESDYDYSTVRAGQVSIGTGRRAQLAKLIE